MNLIFSSEKDFVLNKLEYEALWNTYGERIQASFKKITKLDFKEDCIQAIVGNYESNFAGTYLNEPMLFRYSVRHKLGTILHELAHRLLLEYNFKYHHILQNDHELIDLFLYEVIQDCFGTYAAEERLKYECTFPELEIPTAWNKMLKYPIEKRQKIWNSILKINVKGFNEL